jgi:alkaline phosphatase
MVYGGYFMRTISALDRLQAVFLLTLCLVLSGSAAVTPLPLTTAANAGFSDAQANDRQGGWIDLGGNDLHVLKPGRITAAGVPFEVLDESAQPGKTCIVLGGPTRAYLPTQATLPIAEVHGTNLYLLHGAAWCPTAQSQKMTGKIVVEYADGTASEHHVRFGRDVGDWTKPDGYKNAARSWTAYNGNTQVSLFTSCFALKPRAVKAIRFEAKESTWMIVAVSIGDTLTLKPIKPDLTLNKRYAAPPPFSAPLPDMTNAPAPKNIILIIGDGMGQGALKLTSLYQHKAEGRLLMEQLPVAVLCTTYSASADVTDSAAASTAFACGTKTDNSFLGITSDKKRLTSCAEAAHRQGRAVGLITSDAITGATPAGFYAHEASRGSYQGVASDAAASGFEVLIGNDNGRAWFQPKNRGGQRTDTRNVLDEMTGGGYAVVSNTDAFAQAPQNKRVLGFMDTQTVLGTEPILGQLTDVAMARLSKNDKGFFLMVECTITDGGGHGNKPDLTVLGTTQVDWAVRSAVEFARARGDTLVMVTADHETGGLTSAMSHTHPERLLINYTTTSHTGAPVAFFAFGPGAHLFSGVIDNTDIANTVCRLWQIALPPPAPFAAK